MSAAPTETPTATRHKDEGFKQPIEALSLAEQKLQSLRDKLKDQETDLQKQLENASTKELPPLLVRIQELERLLPQLEHGMSGASNTFKEANGAFTGLQRASGLLRDATSETGIVKSLEKGIAEHQQRARAIAVALIGNHENLIAEFLGNPDLMKYVHLTSINEQGTDVVYGERGEILDDQGQGVDENGNKVVFLDEGKAVGLPFKIKDTFRPDVTKALIKLQDALRNHGPRSKEYNEAQDDYRSAEQTLKQAVLRKHGLLHEVARELRLAQGLHDSIEKINLAAGKVETEMQALRDGNIKTAGEEFGTIQSAHRAAVAELQTHKLEADRLQLILAAWERGREKTQSLLTRMPEVLQTLESAEKLLANVDGLRVKLLRVETDIDEQVTQAESGIDANFAVHEETRRDIAETAGSWKGCSRVSLDNLNIACERLRTLYTDLEKVIGEADAAETHQQLNIENCESVIETGRRLQQFIENEWKKLEGGSEDGIRYISFQARTKLAEVLRPFVALRRLGGVLQAAVEAEGATRMNDDAWKRFGASMDAAAARAGENPIPKPQQPQPASAAAAPAPATDVLPPPRAPTPAPPVPAAAEKTAPAEPKLEPPGRKPPRGAHDE